MNVFREYFERRRRQFRNSWPGFRAFWPGFPIGVAAGVPFLFFLDHVWPEPLPAATAIFVCLAIFLFVQMFFDAPPDLLELAREQRGIWTLIVLAVSAAGSVSSMLVGYTVGRVVRLLANAVGVLV